MPHFQAYIMTLISALRIAKLQCAMAARCMDLARCIGLLLTMQIQQFEGLEACLSIHLKAALARSEELHVHAACW